LKLELDRVAKTLKSSELPTLPSIATELMRLVRSHTASAVHVSNLIATDAALTARILKLVNSAYYGFPSRIDTVNHATVVLGFNRIRDVVLTSSVLEAFRGKAKTMDFGAFWQHSIATAIGSECLARTLGPLASGDAFVAGLLHDIGKLALAVYFPEPYRAVLTHAREHNVLLLQSERTLLGFDHCDVGQIMAVAWSFPAELAEAIHDHHAPQTGKLLPAVVHVADIMARSLLIGSGGDSQIPVLAPEARQMLSLSRESLDRALVATLTGIRGATSFFDMIRTGSR
jgi:putative nucleotidyltransferase with HDIG domain